MTQKKIYKKMTNFIYSNSNTTNAIAFHFTNIPSNFANLKHFKVYIYICIYMIIGPNLY